MRPRPLVSICVPTFRGAPWILETLATALAQTLGDFEVLVVDDASDDDTVARARSIGDPRVRVVACRRNVGLPGNWNRAASLARGRFVKWLLQDDVLYPRCLERLVAPALARDDVDLVFGPRDLIFDEPHSREAREFRGYGSMLHRAFPTLLPVNERGALSSPWIAAHCLKNWIGEPTAVLVRRSALERHGGFHVRMTQLVDMEMWGRLAFHGAVAFVDEPLSAFRVHTRSASRRQTSSGVDWLDQLYLVEGLLRDPAIASAHPELYRWRAHERRRVLRRTLRPFSGGPRLAVRRALPGLRAYAVDRFLRVLGRAPPIHGVIPPVDLVASSAPRVTESA